MKWLMPTGCRYALLGSLLLLVGCSTAEKASDWLGLKAGEEMAKLVDIKPTAHFDVRWRADLGDMGHNMLMPAVTADAVYAVSAKGHLIRLDRSSGKQVWRIDTGVYISGGVGVGEGLVLLGSAKGEVLAYDDAGQLRWRSKVPSEVLSAPQISQGIVMVRSGDGRIIGLDAQSGKRTWIYERSTPALTVRSHAGVTVQRGVVYAGFAGGKLVAINVKDGGLVWEAAVSQPRGSTELERISDVTSNPVVDDEQVCAVAFQGRLACFDIAQGNPLWNREISSDKGLTLLRRFLYLSDVKGHVLALDKNTGSTIWKNEDLTKRDGVRPFAIADFIVTGDYQGYLHGLSRDDGHMMARMRLDGGAVYSAPIELDDGFLAWTRGGAVYALGLR